MGTTLTGKPKATTYDGLIKTTDNDPVTATLKELTDGLGTNLGLHVNNAGDFQVDGVVTGAAYSTRTAIAASDIDFKTGVSFTKTITANTTFTFSNYKVGDIKMVELTGNFTVTWPTGSKRVSTSSYDGTATPNFIQIECTDATTPVFLISYLKEQV